MQTHRSFLTIAALSMAALMFTGCEKERARPVLPAATEVEQIGTPKEAPWFIKGGVNNTGTYTVYKWSGACASAHGTVNSISEAPENLIINANPRIVRLTNGQTTGVDNNYLRLQAGDNPGTIGSWGPWYLIRPNYGPPTSTRKSLLMRIRRVDLNAPTYQACISYDGTANTWSYFPASQQGKYEFVEITGAFNLCESRN